MVPPGDRLGRVLRPDRNDRMPRVIPFNGWTYAALIVIIGYVIVRKAAQ